MKGHGKAVRPTPSPHAGHAAVDMNDGMRVLSHLIAGVALYGGIGWVADYFLDTRFLLPLGIIAGAALGIYTTIRRFGLAAGEPAQSEVSTGEDATTNNPSKEDAR